VHALLATVADSCDRIGGHGVAEDLLRAQATAAWVPLRVLHLPESSTDETYEKLFRREAEALRAEGVERCAFSDLFLQEVRDARARQLGSSGLKPVFPLWGLDTKILAENFIRQGFRAIVVTVDPKKLDPSFIGRDYDLSFLADLPAGVDPCGERGEFHTFVHAGPIFERPIALERGAVKERDGFYCQDLSLL
jgi:uncharacterized protein (TIGR00290 family)